MLEALFEKPFLVFILIAAISSFLGKAKTAGEEEQEQRKRSHPSERRTKTVPKPVQQTRPQPSLFEEMKRVNHPQHRPTFSEVTDELENEFEKRRNEQAAKLKELQEKQQALEKAAEDLHSGMTMRHELTKSKQTSKQTIEDSLPSYGSRLIDGIILSEVLGKPRAKNPHTSRR